MADVSSTGGGGLVPISTDELHKRMVVVETLHDQPVVHAPVVFDTVTVEIP